MKHLALLTSGGDCPGMDTAVRAIVRSALHYGFSPIGIHRGFQGLLEGELHPMDHHSVSGIGHLGGTILHSARTPEFQKKGGLQKASKTLERHQIKALIVLGGEGSLKGAARLSQRVTIPIMGIPASIDNDVSGTDYCIGYDTAINTGLQALDRIRDTATSHERLFLVEAMGHTALDIPLALGVSGGAEEILLPEDPVDLNRLHKSLEKGRKKGKKSSILIVAEGKRAGRAFDIAARLKKIASHYDIRVSVLGHQQRGGSPSAFDRILASRLGHAAVKAVHLGEQSKLVGIHGGRVVLTDLQRVSQKKTDPKELLELCRLLASP